MAFDPKEHLIQLKGKDYLQVAWRLAWLRDIHPEWKIETELMKLDMETGFALFKATISDPGTLDIVATGHGSETRKDFGDYIEKAETKAVGRALAMAGLGTQFCFADFDEEDRIVDAPLAGKEGARKRQDAPKAPSGRKGPPATKDELLNAAKAVETKPEANDRIYCSVCGGEIEGLATKTNQWMTPEQVAKMSEKRYGRKMCRACMEEEHRRRKETSGAAE